MRIALLSAEYPPQPGGVGDYTQQLGTALLARGHNVDVLTIRNGRLQILDGRATNPLRSSVEPSTDWGWRSWRAVIAALERIRPHVLHIQYQTGAYGMHPAINFLPWRLRRLPTRPKIVVTAHDLLVPYLFPKAGPLRGWVTRRLLSDADALIVTNTTDYVQVAQSWRIGNQAPATSDPHQPPVHIPIGSNIAVAPPADYDRNAWRAQLGVQAEQRLIAYFGLISRSKGVDVLLNALAQLPDQLQLLIIGGTATTEEDRTYANEIHQQIEQLGLTQRVQITGHCLAEHVSAHLLAADLAALPFADGATFRRGSLLAALAHGLPVVTTQTSDQTNALRTLSYLGEQAELRDEENVLLVPPNDPSALAQALQRVASDVELRIRLSKGGQALATHFSWSEIAIRHEDLYTRLIKHTTEAVLD